MTISGHFRTKKPKLILRPYKRHPKYKSVVDLRAFDRTRKFFKTRTAADMIETNPIEFTARSKLSLSHLRRGDIVVRRGRFRRF